MTKVGNLMQIVVGRKVESLKVFGEVASLTFEDGSCLQFTLALNGAITFTDAAKFE